MLRGQSMLNLIEIDAASIFFCPELCYCKVWCFFSSKKHLMILPVFHLDGLENQFIEGTKCKKIFFLKKIQKSWRNRGIGITWRFDLVNATMKFRVWWRKSFVYGQNLLQRIWSQVLHLITGSTSLEPNRLPSRKQTMEKCNLNG